MDYPDSPDLYQGKFTDGDPVAGIPASVASAEHMNAVYDELRAAILAGGLLPSSSNNAQLAEILASFAKKNDLFGLGSVLDFRDTVFVTGTPEDLFAKGSRFGFCDTASLGIENRGIYGYLTIVGHYYDETGLSSVYRTFVNEFGQLFQFPVSKTEWGSWISSFDTKKSVFDVVGSNDIKLTSEIGRVGSLSNYDEFTFNVVSTNTDLVTIEIDGLGSWPLSSVTAAGQIFKSAQLTIRYVNQQFFITKQINPKTGNDVVNIGKLVVDTVNVMRIGEYAADGSELSRADHPILWEIVQMTANVIDQSTKDANTIEYAGYYGNGNGSTTFTLPILGGEFIRMHDNGRGVDVGRVFGSYAPDSFKSHSHKYGVGVGDGPDVGGVNSSRINDTFSQYYFTESEGGVETRPRSISYAAKILS